MMSMKLTGFTQTREELREYNITVQIDDGSRLYSELVEEAIEIANAQMDLPTDRSWHVSWNDRLSPTGEIELRASARAILFHRDARLIAAAPDMYEALVLLIEFADPATRRLSKRQPAIEAGKRALVKAQGEELPND
jgi:hypothetical protein